MKWLPIEQFPIEAPKLAWGRYVNDKGVNYGIILLSIGPDVLVGHEPVEGFPMLCKNIYEPGKPDKIMIGGKGELTHWCEIVPELPIERGECADY